MNTNNSNKSNNVSDMTSADEIPEYLPRRFARRDALHKRPEDYMGGCHSGPSRGPVRKLNSTWIKKDNDNDKPIVQEQQQQQLRQIQHGKEQPQQQKHTTKNINGIWNSNYKYTKENNSDIIKKQKDIVEEPVLHDSFSVVVDGDVNLRGKEDTNSHHGTSVISTESTKDNSSSNSSSHSSNSINEIENDKNDHNSSNSTLQDSFHIFIKEDDLGSVKDSEETELEKNQQGSSSVKLDCSDLSHHSVKSPVVQPATSYSHQQQHNTRRSFHSSFNKADDFMGGGSIEAPAPPRRKVRNTTSWLSTNQDDKDKTEQELSSPTVKSAAKSTNEVPISVNNASINCNDDILKNTTTCSTTNDTIIDEKQVDSKLKSVVGRSKSHNPPSSAKETTSAPTPAIIQTWKLEKKSALRKPGNLTNAKNGQNNADGNSKAPVLSVTFQDFDGSDDEAKVTKDTVVTKELNVMDRSTSSTSYKPTEFLGGCPDPNEIAQKGTSTTIGGLHRSKSADTCVVDRTILPSSSGDLPNHVTQVRTDARHLTRRPDEFMGGGCMRPRNSPRRKLIDPSQIFAKKNNDNESNN